MTDAHTNRPTLSLTSYPSLKEWVYSYYVFFSRYLLWKDIWNVQKWLFLKEAMRYSMTGYARLSNLYDLTVSVERKRVPGAFVECGVWRGGSSAVMAQVAYLARSNRKIHLFDSFEGLPEPSTVDGDEAKEYAEGRTTASLQPIGKCVASIEDVITTLFDRFQFNRANVLLHKGWFQETVPADASHLGPIAILRLDGDWYESTQICLENLYDSVVDGGIVIIDDYGHWQGCRKATDEFLESRGLKVDFFAADYTCVYFIKSNEEMPAITTQKPADV